MQSNIPEKQKEKCFFFFLKASSTENICRGSKTASNIINEAFTATEQDQNRSFI